MNTARIIRSLGAAAAIVCPLSACAEVAGIESFVVSAYGECDVGEIRCEGQTLSLCRSDGWAVMDTCGPTTVCDPVGATCAASCSDQAFVCGDGALLACREDVGWVPVDLCQQRCPLICKDNVLVASCGRVDETVATCRNAQQCAMIAADAAGCS